MKDETKDFMIKALAMFSFIILILFIILFIATKDRLNKLKQTEQLYILAQDSLKIVKAENGQQTATISVLTSENTHLFTKLISTDKNVIRLQEVVKYYEKRVGSLNTALIISNQTVVQLQDSIRNIIANWRPDPITGTLYPVYTRAINQPWYTGTITMGLDTTNLKLTIVNYYDVTIGEEKVNLFKKKYFAHITNLNPNTETKVMKVYQKQEVKTKIMKPITVGGVIGLGVGYLLFH